MEYMVTRGYNPTKLENNFMSYKILEEDTVYNSTKLKINRAKISLPNGNVAEWDYIALPDFYYAIPIVEDKVLMTKEWRLGPNNFLTQFTAARCIHKDETKDLNELQRELKEELGLEGGIYEKYINFQQGFRTSGIITYFTVKDFKIGDVSRDENEIQEVIELPMKGLFNELLKNHQVTSDTLLVAKLLEEQAIQ
jgi:hypothetical protein